MSDILRKLRLIRETGGLHSEELTPKDKVHEKAIDRNHDDRPDSNYDPEQLRLGIQVEYEHTNYEYKAKMIAKDHLDEIPDYYTRLLKMEEEAGVKNH